MNQKKLIQDKKSFREALELVNKTFNCNQRFPDQVFKVPFQRIVVLDFDYVMSKSFWNEIEIFMELIGDSSIIMAVLDPNPVDYYYKEFSHYNWCILEKETRADEYWSVLEQGPEESPADAILFNSEVIVWQSSSMKWAIWGERSYGICVLGFNKSEFGDYESESWLTMNQAVHDLISLNFKEYKVPNEIILKLQNLYGDLK